MSRLSSKIEDYQGILLVDKPSGWTSFDVVGKIRSVVAKQCGLRPKQLKVGHSGTLDPMATGLLMIFIGKNYTKQIQEYSGMDKSYQFVARLGASSTTGDAEGEITPQKDAQQLSLEKIQSAASSLMGEITQQPSKFSAIKIDGVRAYKMARTGQEFTMPTRKARVYQLDLVSYKYPELEMTTTVSKGTYVRTLAEDLAESLDAKAYLTQLRRTAIGDFSVDAAMEIQETSKNADQEVNQQEMLKNIKKYLDK